jgi:N utilization substance protein A
MNREELLRMIDSVHRDWEIDKATILSALEEAFTLAIKKHYTLADSPRVRIDPVTGDLTAYRADEPMDITSLGRVAYQSARQWFHQRLKEGKNRRVQEEYLPKKGEIVSALVQRFDKEDVVCEMGRRVEAVLPRAHQIPGESYPIGKRLKAVIFDVENRGGEVAVLLSRTDEQLVRRLFELEVPEIHNGTCVVRGTAREPGYRSKLLVESTKSPVDCVGACVGVRGARIKNIVDELNGENIDIIPWSSDEPTLVRNSLKPASVRKVEADSARKRATVYVDRSDLSQAIGKGGRNVRLASRLTGWEIDVFEAAESTVDAAREKSNG